MGQKISKPPEPVIDRNKEALKQWKIDRKQQAEQAVLDFMERPWPAREPTPNKLPDFKDREKK